MYPRDFAISGNKKEFSTSSANTAAKVENVESRWQLNQPAPPLERRGVGFAGWFTVRHLNRPNKIRAYPIHWGLTVDDEKLMFSPDYTMKAHRYTLTQKADFMKRTINRRDAMKMMAAAG